ncbi:hypothetical protein CEUSTIGMA_g9486.t1 [Chlamydomonas eustigma]|uniref:SP-RING-type domain-containing protein n=1 Tax=Chlamydomonas eustigma TaxID=1157962 RepID=A0A250XG52_9CHLO|nr:hypothetical protein CEUSTIGMA_g9486.t1 [Chlamydomonas eustigma]|eukprot:GAX82058.1 hypothetical protein CEUSTIGMA_g9486.t1 [Chlamydomonas eustigma]
MEVHYTADSVLRGFDGITSKELDLQQALQGVKAQLQDISTTLVDLDNVDKVQDMRSIFKDLLNMDNEISIHVQALNELKRSYQPTASRTDFKGTIKQKTDNLLSSQRFDPEQSAELKGFDKETGVSGAGNNDDDVVEGPGCSTSFRNEKCPLTMKSVYDLAQPVSDQMDFIYEKSALMSYISNHNRSGTSAKCPFAGTSHVITAQHIKPALQVERAKRRRKLKAAAQGQQQEAAGGSGTSNVYDVDDS